MRCLELFAGAGGAALGLERAGFEHAALCEWDANACATLRAAGLGPVVEGDVRDLDAIERVAGAGPLDLLWSSFPCQAWSTAGKQLGAEDDRNGWPWTVDAIDRFRPRWFLAENVRGLIQHSEDGHPNPEKCPRCYFENVILVQLRERFGHVGWWLLDAADYGVPQHRRRVIIWAGPAPLRAPRPTHGAPSKARQRDMFGPGVLPWVTMGEALGVRQEWCKSTGSFGAGRALTTVKGPSMTITTECGRQSPWSSSSVVFLLDSGRNTEAHPNQERPTPSTEPSPAVSGAGNQYVHRPSPAITTGNGHGMGSVKSRDTLERAIGRRRLTVEECATLQAFPSDHPWQGTATSRYRQVGNAVPPPLAEVVGHALLDAVSG
jgi:DNA (cytosine-5)-methyltransferase 1